MKRRLLTLVLAFVLLITLIPLGATRVNAASSFTVSDACVEVIKKWEGFSVKPYWDYKQWTVGYGTKVPDGKLTEYNTNGISVEEANTLLHAMLSDMSVDLNSFIDKFGLTMTQQQFDALLSLTFNCGTGWMGEVSTFRTSVIEGWTGNDFVFAIGQWSTAGGVTLPALIRRRLAEANMYLNGVYESVPPENFGYVRFDANGGESEIVTQGYLIGEPVAIRAVPTYAGCNFEGWYTSATGGEKVEQLDEGVRNYTLYAHWSAGDGADMPQDTTENTITGTPVSYQKEIATGVLSSFVNPVKGALVVDAYQEWDIVEIVAEHTDSSGRKWGLVSNNGGWINLEFTREVSDDAGDGTKVDVTVTATDVNLRRGPGTSYALVGKANKGDKLTITRTGSGSGYTWGKSSKGWICLKYTDYDAVVNGSAGETTQPDNSQNNNTVTTPTTPSTPTTPPAQTTQMGTVVVSDGLRIRSGAGTNTTVLGYLSNGTRVEILEQKTVGGMVWGRINKGWISLNYVKLDGQGNTTTPDTGSNNTPATKVTGKVTLSSGRLNVRSGPSTGYGVVTSLTNGTAVEILEQKTVGATVWGRISKGWISLDYVKLDSQSTPENNKPTTPEATTPPATEPTTPPATEPVTPPAGSTGTKVTGKVVLSSGRLNIRSGAGVNNTVVGSLAAGTAVEITEQKTVNGTVWGKISKGWISMDYVRLDSAASTETEKIGGTVSAGGTSLRIRSGPSTSYAIAGYLADGSRVEILERKTVGGSEWGRIAKGWICLNYVKLDGQQSTSTPNAGSTTQTKTGTVIADCLRIRSGAGTNNKIVGRLYNGEKVTILETTVVDGVTWGRIDKGWISLEYIK